jgi:hypothetical protein
MSKHNGSNTPELINEPDFLAEGFEKLDDHLLDARAPRVKLLPAFHERSHERQVDYLLKLASTMNHAARLISDERDRLVELMVKKEAQLEKMAAQMRANNEMLQGEVARMNEQRQGYNAEVMRLGKRIKELELGNIN